MQATIASIAAREPLVLHDIAEGAAEDVRHILEAMGAMVELRP